MASESRRSATEHQPESQHGDRVQHLSDSRTTEETSQVDQRTTERTARTLKPASTMAGDAEAREKDIVARLFQAVTDAGGTHARAMLDTNTSVSRVFQAAAERGEADAQALMQSWASVGEGMQMMQQIYSDAMQRSAKRAVEWPQSLLRCGTIDEAVKIQGQMYPEMVKSMFETSAAILEVLAQVAQNARTPLSNRAHANN
jgi:hypothetical protein